MEESIKDFDLVEGLKRNDPHYQSLLVDIYGGKLLGFSSSNGLSREDGIEVVNDVFFKVVKNIDKFDFERGSKFKSWVFKIASNCILDKHRQLKASKNEISLEELSRNGVQISTDIVEEPKQIDTQENLISKEILKKAIKKLGVRDQAIIMDRVYGVPHKNIALALNMKVGAVKTAYSRALQKLKKAYINLVEDIDNKDTVKKINRFLAFEDQNEKAKQ